MIKVSIKKQNVITNSTSFDDETSANNWINEQKNTNSFGKNERWVREYQEDVSGAVETRQVEDVPAQSEQVDGEGNVIVDASPAIMVTEYKLPAEYTVEIQDVTAQAQAQKESEEARAYLASTDWYVVKWMDTGSDAHYPAEIKAARALARTKVIN